MASFTRAAKTALMVSTILGLGVTQAAAQQLEEIIVTARKQSESLQDIPLTITAFTEQMIEDRAIRNAQDVVKYTPGLNYDKGFGPQDTRISIRGLPVIRGKPPVGVLLDGIDISSEALSTAGGSALVNVKLVDVESIAVVKGPQSALYGRSAFGGAIVYTSKRPNLEAVEGSASLEAGTYNMYEVRGAVSGPIIEDKLAIRVNGVYSSFDGFHRNTITGERLGGDELAGITGALRFVPAENADFTFRISYSDDKSEGRPSYEYGIPTGRTVQRSLPANAVGLRLGTPPGGAPLPATYTFPTLGRITTTGLDIRISQDPLTGKDFVGGRLRPVVSNLIGEVDFGDVKLSSWTGYVTALSSGRTDADFFGAPATNVTVPSAGVAEPLPALFILDIDVKANQFSQELRLGQETGRFRWAIGGTYWEENYKSDNYSLSTAAAGRPAGFSAARAMQILGRPPGQRNARSTKHESAYGMLSFDITDQVQFDAEARYAHEKVDSIFGQSVSLIVGAGNAVSYLVGAVPINPRPTYTTNMFTPRGVLKYKFDDDNNIYVSVSKGEKPGGYLNTAVVTDTRLVRYNPEKIYNYEAGFKTSWMDNRVNFNGAYFKSINKDRLNQLLIPDAASPQGTSTQAVNIGEARIDGIELETTAALTAELTAAVAYSYLDARYTDSTAPATTAFAVAGPQNCTVATVGPQVVCLTNTNGKRLDFSAKHSLSGSLAYSTPINSDWTLNSSLDVQMRGNRYLDANNLLLLPSYWNVDARIGAETEQYGVTLYVTNLFNDQRVKSGQTSGDIYAAVPPQLNLTAYAADKRQFGVRAKAKF